MNQATPLPHPMPRLISCGLVTCVVLMFLNVAMYSFVTELVSMYLTLMITILTGAFVYVRVRRRGRLADFRIDLPTVFIVTTLIAFCLSIWTTRWPAKLRFELSRSAFESLRQQVDRGEKPEFPRRVGLYRVYAAKPKKHDVWQFRTLGNQSGDFQGIVYQGHESQFNLWSSVELDDVWSYIIVD